MRKKPLNIPLRSWVNILLTYFILPSTLLLRYDCFSCCQVYKQICLLCTHPSQPRQRLSPHPQIRIMIPMYSLTPYLHGNCSIRLPCESALSYHLRISSYRRDQRARCCSCLTGCELWESGSGGISLLMESLLQCSDLINSSLMGVPLLLSSFQWLIHCSLSRVSPNIQNIVPRPPNNGLTIVPVEDHLLNVTSQWILQPIIGSGYMFPNKALQIYEKAITRVTSIKDAPEFEYIVGYFIHTYIRVFTQRFLEIVKVCRMIWAV